MTTKLHIEYSSVSPEWLARQITARYSDIQAVGAELLWCGPRSDRYVLVGPSPNRRYFVKVYGAGLRSSSEIRYEQELLEHLAARGLLVPTVVPSGERERICTIQAPEGTRFAAVFTYPVGKWCVWDDENHSYLAGRALAGIHAASAGFTSQSCGPALDLAYLLKKPMAVLEPILVHRPKDWSYLNGLTNRMAENAREAVSRGLDWGVCQGNLNAQDLLVTEAGEMAVIDFDFSGFGWRAFDLVAPQQSWLFHLQGPMWDAFLRGYRTIRTLDEQDIAALPLFLALSRIWRLGNDAANRGRIGAVYLSDENLDYFIQFFKEWESQHLNTACASSHKPKGQRTSALVPPENIDLQVSLGSPAVTRSVVSSEDVITQIVCRYAIEQPVECHLLRWSSNDTYLLSTRRKRYIVRLYGNRWRSAEEISYELALLIHLAAKGLPVSKPIPDRDGNLSLPINAPEGERQLALFEYRDGRRLSWEDTREARLAGRLAASIHLASGDFATNHTRLRWDLEHMLDRPLQRIRSFSSEQPREWSYLENVVNRLRSRFESPGLAGLDWGVCHGDFNAKNIHVEDETGGLGIFDFDWCGPGWRARDCLGAYRMKRHEPAIWQSFLDGYHEIRSLSCADLEAVSLFPGLIHVWRLGDCAHSSEAWGSVPIDGPLVRSRLKALKQWVEENFRD